MTPRLFHPFRCSLRRSGSRGAPRRGPSPGAWAVIVAAGVGILAVIAAPAPAPRPPAAVPTPPDPTLPLHPVLIRQPIRAPRVETGLLDSRGQKVTTSCATCHATTRPRPETDSAVQLDEFHQGLTYAHGSLTCLSCHHAGNYDRLRLADGREVEFPDALALCAQCHGPQYRDYLHGTHGGMTGHWDLRRGPRDRNHCVDCHDPHAPAYPTVRPVFAPAADRGLSPGPGHGAGPNPGPGRGLDARRTPSPSHP